MNTEQPKDLSIILAPKIARVSEISDQVSRLQVTNDDEQNRAFDLLKILKVFRKAADDERLEGGEWYRDEVAKHNKKYNDAVIKPVDALITRIETACKPYTLEKVKKQKALEEEQRKALEDNAIVEAEESVRQGDMLNANDIIEVAAKASGRLVKSATVRSNYGAVTSSRIVYKFEITDVSLIPREYMIANESLIKKSINDGVKAIPGIKIIEDVSLTSR